MATSLNTHLNTRERVSPMRVITYAGAIIAFLIGSGFATGQEVLQYFASFGLWGIIGTGLLVLILIAFASREFFVAGHDVKLDRPSQIFHYYTGKTAGTFFDYFTVLFCFLSFSIMIAGAGSVFKEQYQMPVWSGAIIIAVAVIITVWFGLSSLVDVIGKIGPIIVVVAILLGLYGIFNGTLSISGGNSFVLNLGDDEINRAGSNWFTSALSYVGFCMLWLAAFLTALGKSATNRKEASAGALTGGGLFAIGCMIVSLGLLTNITSETAGGVPLYQADIPMLIIAGDIGGWVAVLISIMMLLGIYTTAIPLLWTATSRFVPDGSNGFRWLTLVLAVAGTIIGLLFDFPTMVNLIYVISGYIGAILLAMMIIHAILRWTGVSKYPFTAKWLWAERGGKTPDQQPEPAEAD